MKGTRSILLAGLAFAALTVVVPSSFAAATPTVLSVVEGRDTGSGRSVLVLLGNGLTACRTLELKDALGTDMGPVSVDLKSKTMVVLGLPEGLPQGTYTLTMGYGKGLSHDHQVVLSNGAPLPGSLSGGALSPDLRDDLDDAALFGGENPSTYRDATRLTGTLDTDRFSALEDLDAEGAIGNSGKQVAAGDHEHDARYPTRDDLAVPGTTNDKFNPVDWSRLKGIPAGFEDGVDNGSVYTAGNGLSLLAGAFSVNFAGPGTAVTAARSDHDHGTVHPTRTELSATGTLNAGTNPVDWTKLKSVPAGFADGTDANAWTEASGNAYRTTGLVGIGTSTPKAGLHVKSPNGVVFDEANGIPQATGVGNRFMWWADRGAITGGFEDENPFPKWTDATVGRQSLAFGEGVMASGIASVALGWSTTATGDGSVALGTGSYATGGVSAAIGHGPRAVGDKSIAIGDRTTAVAFASVALGTLNVGSGSKTTWVATDPLLVVGNGYDTPPIGTVNSNALVLLKNGDFSAIGSALFTGTYGTGSIPATGAGVRSMWYPAKAAFRAGYAAGTEWDDANIGAYSAASGYGTTASGVYSSASGVGTIASGEASTAMGGSTTASGISSTTMGFATSASGSSSAAMGNSTKATGGSSTAMGFATTAQAYGSLVLGRYNAIAGTTSTWVSTEPVLVVGNGASSASTSNAFTLLKNGNLTIAGTLTQNSDERLKRDIAPLDGVLAKVAAIRGVTYRMKDETRGPGGPQIGLLAQEVRAAFPELVHEDAQGTLSVAYGSFSAVLLEAVKEQQAEIEAKDRKVADLEARLARLERLVEAK